MTFIRFKVHCNHSASEAIEISLIEDDMAWVFECLNAVNKSASATGPLTKRVKKPNLRLMVKRNWRKFQTMN